MGFLLSAMGSVREREFYTGKCMVLFKMIILASVVLKGKIKWEEITPVDFTIVKMRHRWLGLCW